MAWIIMHNWLQNVGYRIPYSWWIFPSAGAIVLIITMVTISYQAIKTAGMNVAVSLRIE